MLGKIIGLDRFNELQQRSRDRARERRERGNFLEGEIEYKRQETAAKPELQKDLAVTLERIRSLSEEMEQKNSEAQRCGRRFRTWNGALLRPKRCGGTFPGWKARFPNMKLTPASVPVA